MVESGKPVVPFLGILFNHRVERTELRSFLSRNLGPFFHESETIPFDATDYYSDEMGETIFRFWVSPEQRSREGELPERKKTAIRLEKKASKTFPVSDRPLNLDPGYVRGNQVVLASTKDADHRLYIGGGLYAELTLMFEDGRFQPLPWTYPDYRSDSASTFFETCRDRYFSPDFKGSK